jgi:hypothetical protein
LDKHLWLNHRKLETIVSRIKTYLVRGRTSAKGAGFAKSSNPLTQSLGRTGSFRSLTTWFGVFTATVDAGSPPTGTRRLPRSRRITPPGHRLPGSRPHRLQKRGQFVRIELQIAINVEFFDHFCDHLLGVTLATLGEVRHALAGIARFALLGWLGRKVGRNHPHCQRGDQKTEPFHRDTSREEGLAANGRERRFWMADNPVQIAKHIPVSIQNTPIDPKRPY